MIIFNTTFHIDDHVHDDCLLYLKETYIAQAVESGFLHSPRLAHIHGQYEESGTSYSLQFMVKNVDVLEHWLSVHGSALQKEMNDRFGNKALGFVTLMEEVEL